MKKILYVISTLKRCGPVKQMLNIIRNLDRTMFEPVVLTLSPEPENSMADELRLLDVEAVCVSAGLKDVLPGGGSRIRSMAGSMEADLIHVHGLRGDIVFSKEREIPVLTTLRNDPLEEYSNRYGPVLGFAAARVHINAVKKIPHKAACSDHVAARYRRYLKTDVRSIDNGIDTAGYALLPDKGAIRERLGLPDDKKVFISTGVLNRRKAPGTVLRGYLNSGLEDDSLLVFAGQGPLSAKLRREAAGRAVMFPGEVENIVDWLNAADCFVFASASEGLPNSVLEALSCGLPVILSDIPPHRYILDRIPFAGRLFSTGDSKAFSAELQGFAAFEAGISHSTIRKAAESYFSAARMSREYQDYYDVLLGGEGKRRKGGAG